MLSPRHRQTIYNVVGTIIAVAFLSFCFRFAQQYHASRADTDGRIPIPGKAFGPTAEDLSRSMTGNAKDIEAN